MFEEWWKLLLGLLTGLVFGFLLQKGQVSKFQVIVGQFLLRDWTVAKIMGTAIVVGGAGVYALYAAGWVELHVKPMLPAGIVLGAVLFGIGMALFGYCPGTGVTAAGEGQRDAAAGVLGMLAGAGVYVAAYPWIRPAIVAAGDWGKLTLPVWTGTTPWLWLALLAAIGLVLAIAARPRLRPPFGGADAPADAPLPRPAGGATME